MKARDYDISPGADNLDKERYSMKTGEKALNTDKQL